MRTETKLNTCCHMLTSSTQLQNRSFHDVECSRTSLCEMCKNDKCTCKAFRILVNNFATFLLPLSSWLHKLTFFLSFNANSYHFAATFTLSWLPRNSTNERTKGLRSKRQLSKSFTVVIQPLSTRLIKANFCFDFSHRRSTTVSSETRNPTERTNCQAVSFLDFYFCFS